MSAAKELKYLREEEKLLVNLLSEFRSQLNRLKIEELALKAAIRDENVATLLENVDGKDGNNDVNDEDDLSNENLNLDVQATLKALAKGGGFFSSEDESDEDD